MTNTHFQPTFPADVLDPEHPRPWLNLQFVLILLTLLAVVPLILIEFASSQREQAERIEQARQNIEALAEVVAERHVKTVEGVGQLLLALATSPVVAGSDRAACSQYFKRLLSLQPSLVNLGVIDPQGRLVCNAVDGSLATFLGDRDYFLRAQQTDQLVMGGFLVGRVTGRKSIVFAQATQTGGERGKSVVYASLDLQWLDQALRGTIRQAGGHLHVVDAAGLVLASSVTGVERVGTPLTDPVLREAVRAGRTGVVAEAANEQPAVLRVLRPVQVRGDGALLVAVTVPTDRVIAPALHNLRLRLAGILGIGVMVAVCVWLLGQRLLVQPLHQLVKGLRAVEQGDFGQALLQPGTPLRELGELQQTLGSMVMGLEAQRFERDQALGALSERETRYRELFKANPQVMYVYDVRSLQFLAVNEAAEIFYGYKHEEFLKLTLLDIRPEAERAKLLEYLAGHFANTSHNMPRVWTHQKKGGETRQVEVIFHATVFGGHAAELVMVTDVTARLAAEARVRELTEELERRVDERTRALQLANQELQAFSYSVSHDLRNPLGAVAMFGQMLAAHAGDTLDAQSQRYLARMDQGLRGMDRLIDDLLALSKLTRDELVMGPVDLSALCHSVLQELREGDPSRSVTVTLEEGLHCVGDERLLRRLLVNLIGNAWKFTAHTPVAHVRIGQQARTNSQSPPVFFVADNGAGFDMKFAGRLFLPFERLHGDQDFPGTGIGLATVQRIVARHGGRVWAEAAVGLGATFYFVINLPRVL
jgi:PAS domain S-box-containing protein